MWVEGVYQTLVYTMKLRSELLRVLTRLNEVEVREAWLEGGPKEWQFGEMCEGVLTVNPMPHIVDTLIHEMLHHIHPDWSEARVKRATTLMMRMLEPDEVQSLYKEYQAWVT